MLEGLTRRFFLKAAPAAVAAAPLAVEKVAKSTPGDGVALGDARLYGKSVTEMLDRHGRTWSRINDDPAVAALYEDWNRWQRRREVMSDLRYQTNGLDPEIACLRSASLHTRHRLQLAKLERAIAEEASWSGRLQRLKSQVAQTLGLSPEELKQWTGEDGRG